MRRDMIELADKPDKACALDQLLASLALVRSVDKLSTADLQRHLACRYGIARKVLNALCELSAIEPTDEPPGGGGRTYISLIGPSRVK